MLKANTGGISTSGGSRTSSTCSSPRSASPVPHVHRASHYATALDGFSAGLSTTLLQTKNYDELDDQVYNDKFEIDELLGQLRLMVYRFKPKQPLHFMKSVIDHILDTKGEPADQRMPLIPTQEGDSEFYKARGSATQKGPYHGRGSRRSSSNPVSPTSVLSNTSADSKTMDRSKNQQHNVIVSVRLVKPKLLIQPTFNFRFSQYFGMDIGGSLAKVTFYEPSNAPKHIDPHRSFITTHTKYGSSGTRDPALSFSFKGGRFHFLHFNTNRMEGALKMIKTQGLSNLQRLLCTGGGAFKFEEQMKRDLNVGIDHRDEITCLLTGLNFLLEHVPDESYYLENVTTPHQSTKVPQPIGDIYPYLLVNVGSGVSILRVDNPQHFERIGGSPIGGGTFWGLARLLLSVEHFEEALSLCEKGDRSNVDMLVGDIYGGDYEQFGLKASTVASAFGKFVMQDKHEKWTLAEEDIAASLLHLVGNNIAQVAYLSAVSNNISRIVFAGNFLRGNIISQCALSYSIKYWSQGAIKALFLKHEGYFGSTGALLLQGSDESRSKYEILKTPQQTSMSQSGSTSGLSSLKLSRDGEHTKDMNRSQEFKSPSSAAAAAAADGSTGSEEGRGILDQLRAGTAGDGDDDGDNTSTISSNTSTISSQGSSNNSNSMIGRLHAPETPPCTPMALRSDRAPRITSPGGLEPLMEQDHHLALDGKDSQHDDADDDDVDEVIFIEPPRSNRRST